MTFTPRVNGYDKCLALYNPTIFQPESKRYFAKEAVIFKFIHAADLHLDSPLRGLQNYEGAPSEQIRGAARQALSNLVDLATEESVQFVLIAGDIYDGDWQDYNTGRFFIGQIARLRDAAIPVFMISGNHDAANTMTRSLRLPDNVTFFSSDKPETATLDALNVCIHAQSFATQAVTEDLSAGYPDAVSGNLNIGILHTSATGRDGHANYAPCTVDGLKRKNYDYWALGHIHQRETLSTQPFIGFSGNIQGRHIRETGPKGCLLVTVDDAKNFDHEFRPLDVMRWERLIVGLDHVTDPDIAIDRVTAEIETALKNTDGRLLAVRIELTGETKIHSQLHAEAQHWLNEIRSQAMSASQSRVWIEKIKIHTTPVKTPPSPTQIPDSAMEELNSMFQQIRSHPETLSELGFEFEDVFKKLPADLKKRAVENQSERLTEAIEQAESILKQKLLGES